VRPADTHPVSGGACRFSAHRGREDRTRAPRAPRLIPVVTGAPIAEWTIGTPAPPPAFLLHLVGPAARARYAGPCEDRILVAWRGTISDTVEEDPVAAVSPIPVFPPGYGPTDTVRHEDDLAPKISERVTGFCCTVRGSGEWALR